MTEATIRVTYDTKTRGKTKPWWAEVDYIDGKPPGYNCLGFGATPGEAVDDSINKMSMIREVPS